MARTFVSILDHDARPKVSASGKTGTTENMRNITWRIPVCWGSGSVPPTWGATVDANHCPVVDILMLIILISCFSVRS